MDTTLVEYSHLEDIDKWSVVPPFKHERGLRQGDPLSPYLFILAADVLQRMTTNSLLAIPHSLSAKIPQPIVNLQYADDTILIASAKGSTLRILVLVIHCFTLASGLKINYDKSSFVPFAIQQHLLGPIAQLLQCSQGSLPITYLGMPLTINKPTKLDYQPLLQKLERRLQGWKARLLSRAGKLQLVRSVLSSIPTYFMSCFKFPKWLLQRIDFIRRHFLWSRSGNMQPIHLINWHVVCLPKQCGGLGVINLHLQNMALLLRWLWRLYAGENKLWGTYAAMIHAVRPTPGGPLILSSMGSFFWKSLLKLRPIFSNSVRFQIQSGRRISFWFDPWMGQPIATSMQGKLCNRNISLFEARQMGATFLQRPLTFHQFQVVQELMQYTPVQGEDKLIWTLSASGQFSVKSIYRILSQGGKLRSGAMTIWKIPVTPSVRLFLFLLLNNRLLTHDVMQHRNMIYESGCVMCDRQRNEDAMHLFFTCTYAIQLWSSLSEMLAGNITVSDSTLTTYLLSVPQQKEQRRQWSTTFSVALWFLWRERNQRTFQNKTTPVSVLAGIIQREAELYMRHC